MLGSEERLQSFIDNFILPLCTRYKNNIYFWAIDLCNEPDWAIGLTGTSGPLSTTRGSTCTIEGNGSKLLTFSKRISDYIEGQVFAINGMNCFRPRLSMFAYNLSLVKLYPVISRITDKEA